MMKKLLFCVFTALLAANIFAEDTEPTPEQKVKAVQWRDQLSHRESIHVTPTYSNAVYQAIQPRLAEAVQQLELPLLPQPFTAEQLKGVTIGENGLDVIPVFEDDSSLLMDPFGLFYRYHSPFSLFYEAPFLSRAIYVTGVMGTVLDVDAINKAHLPPGEGIQMRKEEVIDMARQLKERLCKTGYSDDMFSIEGEPQINGPYDIGLGFVSYAKVSWGENLNGGWYNQRLPLVCRSIYDALKPSGNYFEVEIDIGRKQIVSFWVKPSLESIAKHFSYQVPEGLPFELTEKPETETEYKQRIFGKRYTLVGQRVHVTKTFSNAVLKIMLPRVTELAKKLELPIELPITEDQVEEFKVSQYGYIGGRLFLKNGWEFCMDGSWDPEKGYQMLVCSPHSFFPKELNWDKLKDFYGTNKMTEAEIIEYSKNIANRLGFGELLKDQERPDEMKGPFEPEGRIGKEIPRVSIRWDNTLEGSNNSIKIEFNTETKELDRVGAFVNKSLFKDYDLIMGHAEDEDLYPETEAAYRARIKKEKAN